MPGTVLGMSAENARDCAETWVASSGLPAELRGRVMQLVAFVSDADCFFFYPRRYNIWQQQVNTGISRLLKKRHAKIHRVTLSPQDYHAWRADRADTPDLRRSYADGFQRLLEQP
jgi:hypothetical protein